MLVCTHTHTTCRVWDVSNGQMLNTLVHHCEAVLHLRFNNNTMVTCSKVSSSLLTYPPLSSVIDGIPTKEPIHSYHIITHTH